MGQETTNPDACSVLLRCMSEVRFQPHVQLWAYGLRSCFGPWMDASSCGCPRPPPATPADLKRRPPPGRHDRAESTRRSTHSEYVALVEPSTKHKAMLSSGVSSAPRRTRSWSSLSTARGSISHFALEMVVCETQQTNRAHHALISRLPFSSIEGLYVANGSRLLVNLSMVAQ